MAKGRASRIHRPRKGEGHGKDADKDGANVDEGQTAPSLLELNFVRGHLRGREGKTKHRTIARRMEVSESQVPLEAIQASSRMIMFQL